MGVITIRQSILGNRPCAADAFDLHQPGLGRFETADVSGGADAGELFGVGGVRTVAEGVRAWNPVFDVTAGELIDAIVTEKGVIERPTVEKIRAAFGD